MSFHSRVRRLILIIISDDVNSYLTFHLPYIKLLFHGHRHFQEYFGIP